MIRSDGLELVPAHREEDYIGPFRDYILRGHRTSIEGHAQRLVDFTGNPQRAPRKAASLQLTVFVYTESCV